MQRTQPAPLLLPLLLCLVLGANLPGFVGQQPAAGQSDAIFGPSALSDRPGPGLPRRHPRQFDQLFAHRPLAPTASLPPTQGFFKPPSPQSSIPQRTNPFSQAASGGFFAASPPPTVPSGNPFFDPKSVQHTHHQHKDPSVFDEAVWGASNVKPQTLPGPPTPLPNPSFASLPAVGGSANFCPNGVRVRKEFRDLTWDEWTRYLAAVKKMYIPDTTGRSKADRFTRIHLDNAAIAHNTAHFLPWHRWFTYLYEEELRKFDPAVTIPYWDWTFDAQAPLHSPLFRPEYLGLKTGRAGDCNWIVSYPRRHCVVRNYRAHGFGAFYGRRTIDRLITDTRMSWAEFAELLESSPHGIVHFKVGGPGGDLTDMASPNDPLFFLHHSMVDYVWVQRQEFTGQARAFGGKHRGRRATGGDELRPFRVTVEETFQYDRLCYTYQPFSGWLHAAPAALRAGANVEGGAAEAQHRLPDPLSDQWIRMHGWTREWVEVREKRLQEMESTPLTADLKSGKKFENWLHRDVAPHIGTLHVLGPLVLIAVGAVAAVAAVRYL